jgi:hypothetical protein
MAVQPVARFVPWQPGGKVKDHAARKWNEQRERGLEVMRLAGGLLAP